MPGAQQWPIIMACFIAQIPLAQIALKDVAAEHLTAYLGELQSGELKASRIHVLGAEICTHHEKGVIGAFINAGPCVRL